MTSRRLSAGAGLRKRNDEYDYDLDDRLHDVNRVDESWSVWPSLRRSRALSLLGLLTLLYLCWTAWPRSTAIKWSRMAYVQYATDEHNLCNAVMVFQALKKYGSKAERVLLHHPQWATKSEGGRDIHAELLSIAEKKYGVKLKAVQILDSRGEVSQAVLDGQPSTWDTSVTKLRALELTEYDRIIHLDSDITLLDKLDELFFLPRTPMAMPRAYWTDGPSESWPLTSLLMVFEPNPSELKAMIDTLRAWRRNPELNLTMRYDMDLLNNRFKSSALVLPHRPYALLSAEFRSHDHTDYLGTINGPHSKEQAWDADRVFKEAKLVHFSDWPLPKPWMMWPEEALVELQPECTSLSQSPGSCREREIWTNLYHDFRQRRREICRILPVNAPNWEEWKSSVGWSGKDHV